MRDVNGARVRSPSGDVAFGAFLAEQAHRSGRAITSITKAAGVSRANWYLIQAGRTVPSLLTVARLLGALELPFIVAPPGDDSDLIVSKDGVEHRIALGGASDRLRDRAIDAAVLAASLTLPPMAAASFAARWLTKRNLSRLVEVLAGPRGRAMATLLDVALDLAEPQLNAIVRHARAASSASASSAGSPHDAPPHLPGKSGEAD